MHALQKKCPLIRPLRVTALARASPTAHRRPSRTTFTSRASRSGAGSPNAYTFICTPPKPRDPAARRGAGRRALVLVISSESHLRPVSKGPLRLSGWHQHLAHPPFRPRDEVHAPSCTHAHVRRRAHGGCHVSRAVPRTRTHNQMRSRSALGNGRARTSRAVRSGADSSLLLGEDQQHLLVGVQLRTVHRAHAAQLREVLRPLFPQEMRLPSVVAQQLARRRHLEALGR